MGSALRVLALVVAASLGGAEQSAQELTLALQRHYDAVRDFSADFAHTYQGGVLRKQITERGHLLVKKPGRMRWEYAAPAEKLFVSDGTKLYSYLPQDKQVIVSSVPQGDDAAAPMLFLSGKGNLTRDFTSSLTAVPAGFPADSKALKLVPRNPQRDYDWLTLAVDPQTLVLRGLVTTDAQGGTSSFSFTNLKENVAPPVTSAGSSPPQPYAWWRPGARLRRPCATVAPPSCARTTTAR